MLLLDVNVVVAGHRADHPRHAPIRSWLEGLWDQDAAFTVPLTVWASFLCLVTNRRIFTVPSTVKDAFEFLHAVRAQPGHLALEPGHRHLALLHQICDRVGARGDLVPDAVLAAIATEHGCTVATLDRDFARFSQVAHRLL
jgi:toxin-antitoxin system PIN domain toxin